MYCQHCGNQLDDNASFCPNCGVATDGSNSNIPTGATAQTASKGKSKLAAGLFGILLGGLGVHRFYLGNAIGVLYLLFCWTGIPSIVGLIEGIIYLTMSDKDFDEKYNR